MPLQFFYESFVKRAFFIEGCQEEFVCVPGIADLKESPQVAGVGGHAVVFEDLPGVVIGDAVVFYFAGVVCKGDPLAV